MKYQHYAQPESIREAWELNRKKSNRILAGGLWLRYQQRPFDTAIDLKKLSLDRIEKTKDGILVGANVTLHMLETDAELNRLTGGAFQQALSRIVGVQFRNAATVGGSVYSRFGFSDLIPLLLLLDTRVLFYDDGPAELPLRDYVNLPKGHEVLTHILLPVTGPLNVCCMAHRASATGFPLLICDATLVNGRLRAAIGARPRRAMLLEQRADESDADFTERVRTEPVFGSNAMAGKAYRERLAGVYMERCIAALKGGCAE